jgi:hypothetical protein
MVEPVRAGSSRPRAATDVSAADWVVEGVGEFASGVKGLLPAGFEAYARIPHRTAAGEAMHDEPWVGELPPGLLSALCEVLAEHTATPERCWFCLWDGWGWIWGSPSVGILVVSEDAPQTPIQVPPAFPPEVLDGPRVSLPQRDYILFEGPLDAAGRLGWASGELLSAAHPEPDFDPEAFHPQSPSLFWPHDRSWCVATEIDLDSTYLGGSNGLVRALLEDPRFDGRPARLDDRIDAGGEQGNG